MKKKHIIFSLIIIAAFLLDSVSFAFSLKTNLGEREEKRKQEMDNLQKKFEWWPTDAQPGPVKDEQKGGYWWMPRTPGTARPWGNRGYIYLYKIIFDYKAEELPPPTQGEPRPSLLIKKIVKNVKIYFDFDKDAIRDDAKLVLDDAYGSLKRSPETSILITGNCDIRGTETYNDKLGKQRADAVKQYMLDKGLDESRIRIISRGKLDAIAPVTDLVGMQKDRNAQFMVAEVEEVMIPYQGTGAEAETPAALEGAQKVEEGKYIIEQQTEITGEVRVEVRDYVIQKGDTLWKIAEKELGNSHRWKYIYDLNKDKIKNPDKLKVGQKIEIPIE
jgi:outer membrane protein OmpA-like peptidoglycan-associated protein/LysM repeat protein